MFGSEMVQKCRQVSPERAKVWTEKSPKYYQPNRRVPVVYYLCRNRQFEHPHFIEVPLSSPDGLYLRDVIERLNILRGRGMASLYSWSCKRSYRNGFVWHDLSEDDLILPVHGNEYVLKGSELFEESCSDRFNPVGNSIRFQNLKLLPESPSSSRSQDDYLPSSSLNGNRTKISQDDENSPPANCPTPGSSGESPECRYGNNSSLGCPLSLTEYKVYNSGLADASTQTEENTSQLKRRETCTRGVSTDDGSIEPECNANFENRATDVDMKDNSEICRNSGSSPFTSSGSSSGGKTETLESLIRADASKINSFRILEEEEIRMRTNPRLKATNMLMQFISCGSISVKDHHFSLIQTYRPRFSHSKFSPPLCLSENPKLIGLRLEDKEYFSGSLIETKTHKGHEHATMKRSSSCNADRSCKELDSTEEKEELHLGRTKCIPLSVKASLSKQPRSESMRSPVSDNPRNSSDGIDNSRSA
ncbi:hypothetical protein V6N13_019825 [Hibiscus sabdariffa]|uniref:SOSEKI DIX-like domain-containing protein n=1 Tax=Hibiscus sabdariffa TaxID=183260 RepID=A0ABR2ERL2_9ROSI